jgi:hypothetical protein
VVWIKQERVGDVIKLLLVKLIRLLIADAGVATLAVVVVKIVRPRWPARVGKSAKSRPVAGFRGSSVLRRDQRLSAWVIYPVRALS